MTILQPRERDASARAQIDPHRPRYHFLPREGWLNDPNGLIQWKGTYHLFYQHNPDGAWHGTIHWGHAKSRDLVHWTHLPIALAPTPGSPDEDGCFSGCAVGDHGVPTIIYTGVQGERQLPCLATSDDELITWHKSPRNPIIVAPPSDLDTVIFRDHSVWNEAGVWYQVIGSGIKDVGATALLYRSDDLRHWEYLHPLYGRDKGQSEPMRTGPMWECPDFFALGNRHVLIVSVHDGVAPVSTISFVGHYEQHRFTSDRTGSPDFGASFYAPQSMTDTQGRRIMWGWLREERRREAQRAAGWSGVMSLPRVLSLSPAGALTVAPAPELRVLRGKRDRLVDRVVPPDGLHVMEGVEGAALEIVADFEPGGATAFGLLVRRSSDGREETRIVYDCHQQRLAIDTQRSSLDTNVHAGVHGGTVPLAPGETLRLHVFLDQSIVELFANDLACITERIYPSRADSLGLGFFSEGGTAKLRSMDIWEMQPAWPPWNEINVTE